MRAGEGMTTNLNPHIFREYDIRGDADRDLADDLVGDIGRALGTLWSRNGAQRIGVGRDCRLSSPRLHSALSRGIRDTGVTVVDLGMCPSPVMYFSVFHHGLDGACRSPEATTHRGTMASR